MWIVAKVNNKEFNTFKKSLISNLGILPEIYGPKILIDKLIKNKIHRKKEFILNNYIFLKHDKFLDKKILSSLNYLKGLDMILPFSESSQYEITNFIKKCKENENTLGYLSQSFFDLILNKQVKFNSGPFSKFIGKLIEIQKNKIKVLVKNCLITVNTKNIIVV